MLPPGGRSFTIDIAVMLLPHPDSPTKPSVSPSATWSDRPSTARTVDLVRRMWGWRPSISRTLATVALGAERRSPDGTIAADAAALGRSRLDTRTPPAASDLHRRRRL